MGGTRPAGRITPVVGAERGSCIGTRRDFITSAITGGTVVGSGCLEASSPSDNRCGLTADFLMMSERPASRDAWSVRMWMRRGLTDDRSVDRTDNRVLPRFACTSLTCAGKTCVSDNRVLAACQERTMYHQLSDGSQVRSIDPTVKIGPRNVEARTILHDPAVSLSPGPFPHPSKMICPVHHVDVSALTMLDG